MSGTSSTATTSTTLAALACATPTIGLPPLARVPVTITPGSELRWRWSDAAAVDAPDRRGRRQRRRCAGRPRRGNAAIDAVTGLPGPGAFSGLARVDLAEVLRLGLPLP